MIEEYTSVSVAGTHGKTTTTGMVSHMMSLVAPTGYLIGDEPEKCRKTANILSLNSEYKRHFLAYRPNFAILTNIELDHVDYYKDLADYCDAFERICAKVEEKRNRDVGDDANVRSLKVTRKHLYYGLEEDNDVRAVNVIQNENGMSFDVIYQNTVFGSFKLPFVGKPYIWNSLGVIALGIMEGLSAQILQEGLSSFPGVKRRFTIEENHGNVYIDDYAYHPTAVQYMIEAARTKYPNRKIIALFKPDRYSHYYFIDRFAQALNLADEVFLCHFPENVQRRKVLILPFEDLADKIEKAVVIEEDESAARMLAKRGPAVYLFMSSKVYL